MNISVDLSKFDLESKGKAIINAVTKAMRQEVSEVMRDSVEDNHHRYKRRNGQLNRSVVHNSNEPDLTAGAHLDTGIAFYGPYIHEGHGTHKNPAPGHYSWQPDPFLTDALERRRTIIAHNVEMACNEAIARG